jgi:hypothetical protein
MNNSELRPDTKGGHYLFYGYIVVAVALLIIILDYGSRLTIGVFFKPMLNKFNRSRGLTSDAVTLSMQGQGTGAIIMGRLNDKLVCQYFRDMWPVFGNRMHRIRHYL